MVRTVVVVCAGLLIAVNVVAQGPPPPPPPPPAPPTMEPGAATTGTGAISGIVTDGTTGAPLAGVLVSLVGGGTLGGPGLPPRPRQMTDSKGRYIFPNLPPSQAYSISATAIGYLDGGYRRVPGVPALIRLVLEDGQWFTEGHVQMWKPAAISGTVRDERGEPIVGIPVRVLVGATVAGRARWAGGPITLTDDRGHYRVGGLQRGRYVVHVPSVQITLPSGEVSLYRPSSQSTNVGAQVSTNIGPPLHVMRTPDGTGVMTGHYPTAPPDARGSAYPPLFHPAARSIDQAGVVRVEFGDNRADIDVHMAPVSTVSIAGMVAGPAETVTGIPVRLLDAGNEGLGFGSELGLTRADAAGHFTFHRVPQGRYVILVGRSVSEYRVVTSLSTARIGPSGANPYTGRLSSMQVGGTAGVSLSTSASTGADLSGRVEVTVDGRALSGIVVPASPTVTVSGHFEWDGSEAPPQGLNIGPSVRLEPADGDLSLGTYFSSILRPTEGATRVTFSLENVKPGRYILGELSAAGHRFSGATWRGRDLLETPLEVTGEAPVTDVVVRMSTQRNVLKGTVTDASGGPPADALVLAFPAASASWRDSGVSAPRIRTTTVVATGTFEFVPLLPGDYFIAAIPMADRYNISDPAYLALIAKSATRVRMEMNTSTSVNLRMIGGTR